MGLFDGIQRIATGDVAHDAADAGSPVKIGARAITGKIARVSINDRVHALANVFGGIIVSNGMNVGSSGSSGSIADADDMTYATSLSSAFSAVDTNAFLFNQNNWASGHAEQFYRIPMFGFRSVSIMAYAALGVVWTANLYINLLQGTATGPVPVVKVASVSSVGSGGKVFFLPFAAGVGTSTEVVFVDALQAPMGSVIVGIDPVSQPATGECRVYATRQ